ncbi:MAG TPA: aminopeptidase P family N-terminal domain-containing protein, partial [Allosphingosinicella sp.]
MPEIGRRGFALGALAAGAALAVRSSPLSAAAEPALKPMTGDVAPIGTAERLERLAKAQRLMRRLGLGAILIEPGASLDYFTGVQWWRSERLTAALIPAQGEPVIFTPFFEEPSVRESLKVPAEVRTWVEHEDPLKLVAGALRDRGLAGRPVGIEETVRFFAVDGLRKAMPGIELRSGAPVVRGCRMIKSLAELRLMQK